MKSDHDEANPALPREVRDLIREHVHTVEQLEVLVWLARHPPGEESVRIASELALDQASVETAFARLSEAGLVARSRRGARARYQPNTPALAAAVRALDARYPRDRAEVLTLISHGAVERVREAQERAFANTYLAPGSKKED